jgi:hypothetical protein
MQHLECRARMLGARHMFGEVLRRNTAMKSLTGKADFSVRSHFTDSGLVEIFKDLMPEAGLPAAIISRRVRKSKHAPFISTDKAYPEGRSPL